MLPWLLYNLTPRDQASPTLRLVNVGRAVVHAGAGPHNQVMYTVPAECVLICTNIYLHVVPGGSLTAESEVTADHPTAGNLWRSRGKFYNNIITQLNRTITLDGATIYLPEKTVITGQSTPDAAGCAHYFSVNGVLIPHGTIAQL